MLEHLGYIGVQNDHVRSLRVPLGILAASADRSQALSAFEFPDIVIEGSKGKMARLPGDLQNQAIRKAKGRFVPKVRQRRRDHVRILERETAVIQKHVDSGGAPLGLKFVH